MTDILKCVGIAECKALPTPISVSRSIPFGEGNLDKNKLHSEKGVKRNDICITITLDVSIFTTYKLINL